MHLPKAVFIDTCILDAQQFNFSTQQFSALAEVAKEVGLKLLLPEPMELEINRHIRERAAAALSALKSARKKNSLLNKIDGLPTKEEYPIFEHKIAQSVKEERSAFNSNFERVPLDYSSIDLEAVMRWYDRGEAPFGAGGKRKEFPDAFAFSTLCEFAEKSGESVAVVSSDNDFKRACADVKNLHCFPSLASLTKALLSEDEKFESAQKIAVASVSELEKLIAREFPDRMFDHASDPDGRGSVEDIEVGEVDIDDSNIELIGLGHEELVISFSADVSYSAFARYSDPDSWVSLGDGEVMFLHGRAGEVDETTEISATARISTNSEWTETLKVLSVEIDQDFIEVEAEAPEEEEEIDDQH